MDATHLGPKTTYYYNFPAKTVKAKTLPFDGNKRLTTFYTYDSHGNILSETEPADLSVYSPAIDPETVDVATLGSLVPPIRTVRSYSYDYANNDELTSVTDQHDANVLVTSFQYTTDAEGYLVTTVTDPTQVKTVTRRYTDGRIRDVTDGNQTVTSYAYRADKLLEAVTDPAGVVNFYSDYDANGNNKELQIKDADGTVLRTVSMEFDARNRLRKSTTKVAGRPDVVTAYDYDGNGNRSHVKDGEGRDTWYQYNYDGQVTAVTDAANKVTSYEYGSAGTACPSCGGGVDKLTEVRDPRQTADARKLGTRYSYDKYGHLEYETDPVGKRYHYTYYDHGRVKEKFDATDLQKEVLLITYSYDNDGRLLNKHYGPGEPILNAPDEGYTYDKNGRLATAYNANTTYTYDYHSDGSNKGRLKSVTDNSGRQIYYDNYDGLGQKKQVTILKGSADQRSVTYDYDKNRPWKIASRAGTFTYSYDKAGRRGTLSYPSPPGITTTYVYDKLDRATAITHAKGTTRISFTNYSGFDKVGNRKSRITGSGAERYEYDALYRLIAVTADYPKESASFTYDSVGNRLSGPGAKDVANSHYIYDNANRMTTGRQLSYGYDNAGNQTSRTNPAAPDKQWVQTWDAENRLTKVEITKGAEKRTVSFSYDPFGRRIGKQLTVTAGGVTKNSSWTYVYEGDDVAVEIYTDAAGKTEKTFYTHGAGTDEHLALERGGSYYYYLSDAQGSVIAITDASGAVIQSYDYKPFGMPSPSTFRNSYAYTGREWDKETGLYYYRARYYDPMEGRFISKDPIGFEGGLNLYNYVSSNPITFVDPFGLLPAVDPNDPFNSYEPLDESVRKLKDYYKKKARRELVKKCIDKLDYAFWKSLGFKLTVGWTVASELYNPAKLNEGEDEIVKKINEGCMDCRL